MACVLLVGCLYLTKKSSWEILGKDPRLATPEELHAASSYDPTEEDKILRVSKSSFMGYRYCPRQYWWQRVQLKDVRTPATPAMIRGTYIHDALENLYNDWEGQNTLRPLLPRGEYDESLSAIAEMEERRIEEWGIEFFKPYEVEDKRIFYDEENDIVIVGKIDGVLHHPEGGLCILELKTGSFNDNKISKTRLELCFYERMMRMMGEEKPITHFAFMGPDADNEKMLNKLLNTRGKVVMTGKTQGIMFVEKVTNRALNRFAETFPETIERLKNEEWPMNWNDFTCTQWCDFNLACESELDGGVMEWSE